MQPSNKTLNDLYSEWNCNYLLGFWIARPQVIRIPHFINSFFLHGVSKEGVTLFMFSKDDDYDYAFAVVYFLYNDGNVR